MIGAFAFTNGLDGGQWEANQSVTSYINIHNSLDLRTS